MKTMNSEPKQYSQLNVLCNGVTCGLGAMYVGSPLTLCCDYRLLYGLDQHQAVQQLQFLPRRPGDRGVDCTPAYGNRRLSYSPAYRMALEAIVAASKSIVRTVHGHHRRHIGNYMRI